MEYEPAEESSSGPGRGQMIRAKYARIRSGQEDELNRLARDLQEARTSRSERITANTLIRVAVDALLAHPDWLSGDNEAELRANFLAHIRAGEWRQQ